VRPLSLHCREEYHAPAGLAPAPLRVAFLTIWRRPGTATINPRLLSIVIPLAVVFGGTAHAGLTVDMAKLTCRRASFIGATTTSANYLALWLVGYYSGHLKRTVIDIETLERNANKIKHYCRIHREETIMHAADGAWLATDSKAVAFALNLVPFAGIAFLWFIGVLRDRLGQEEDRFFASVFFGSALLFLAMLFITAAVGGAVILLGASAQTDELINSETFRFARATAYIVMNVYAVKMAAVFMISTSTLIIYTAIAPRWIAFLGYLLAVGLLIGSYYIRWSFAVLPLWVFLISVYILLENLGRQQKTE
jgi:hypothetical protein